MILIPNLEEVAHDDEVVSGMKGLCPSLKRIDLLRVQQMKIGDEVDALVAVKI